jgi:glycosyltransferase involved in cell wall biosynthesis
MTTPLVTALIPAYNAAATIRRAVDSVLAQTYSDYEIIVVDDGSRDATADILANEYGDRVRLLRLPKNQGESAATNEGIARARGELIAFLDADDEWLPDKLEKQVAVLRRNPDAVMVSCGCRFLDAAGNVVREFGLPPASLDRNEVWRLLLARTCIAKPCVLARRSALLDAGPFDTSLAIAEDQDMWIRLATIAPVEFVPEFLTTVHDTAGSLTKVYARKMDRYVLPMVRRHVERQRHRLSAGEVRRILAERYAAVGRNLYRAGAHLRGMALLMRAAVMGYHVGESLWYLFAASPPARVLKHAIGYSVDDAVSHDPRSAARQDRSLLRPLKQDLVALPSGSPILIVMVDAEAEFDWDGPFLRSLVSVRNLSRQGMLQNIYDRFGVRPTFLVDYAVATRPEGYEPVRDLLRTGRCEVGAHLQPWENPPFAEELGVHTSFNHNLPAWLQKEKLRRLTDAIIESFDIKPVAYRAGRYGVGNEIASILASLGYLIDVSVLHGHDLRRRHGPDFRRTFGAPYWFGPDKDLLEIPLTTVFSGVLAMERDTSLVSSTLYTVLCNPEAAKWHLPGIFARLGLLERITLTPEGMSIQEMKRLTRLLLRRGQRVFTLNYHSSSLLPGYTPYVRTPADLDRMVRTVEEYLHYFVEELHGTSMTPMELRDAVLPRPSARPRQLVEAPAQ